jgi:hypothetical protein
MSIRSMNTFLYVEPLTFISIDSISHSKVAERISKLKLLLILVAFCLALEINLFCVFLVSLQLSVGVTHIISLIIYLPK